MHGKENHDGVLNRKAAPRALSLSVLDGGAFWEPQQGLPQNWAGSYTSVFKTSFLFFAKICETMNSLIFDKIWTVYIEFKLKFVQNEP
jgi:hypothetical protein